MSFEGYFQCFCEDGHYYTVPCSYGEEDYTCPFCKKPAKLVHTVDDTNCDSYGILPDKEVDKLRIVGAVYECCPTCGHAKIISQPRYRIPDEAELRTMEHYYDQEDGRYMPLSDLREQHDALHDAYGSGNP